MDVNKEVIKLITPINLLIVFGVCIFISLLCTVIYSSYDKYDKSKGHIFISIFAGILIIFTVIFGMLISYSLASSYELNLNNQRAATDKVIFQDLEQYIAENSTIVPYFVQSISPLSGNFGATPSQDDLEHSRIKVAIASHIFMTFDYFVREESIIAEEPSHFIYYLLQYCNSQELFELWEYMKYNYNSDVRSVGDILFEYALPITDQTYITYLVVTEELVHSAEFQDILKKIRNS